MKNLIAMLLSGLLGIIPVGCVFAEELSSGDEGNIVMDKPADSNSETGIFTTEEVVSSQEEASIVNEIYEPEEAAPKAVLSSGGAEGDLLESGEEIPPVGDTYAPVNGISIQKGN